MLLFGAVFIPTGEGACACPGGSAYPHYCSLLTRVDSAEADKVGSQSSASARTLVLQLMRACGITARPGAFNFPLFLSPVRRYDLLELCAGVPASANSLHGVGGWPY